MSKIHREEWSDELAEDLMQDFAEMQDEILVILAKRLEETRKMTDEEIRQYANSIALVEAIADDIRYIRRRINNQDRVYALRIHQMFGRATKDIFADAKKYFDFRGIKVAEVMKNSDTVNLVKAMEEQTVSGLRNLSHTFAFDSGGEVSEIGKAYRKIVNKAVEEVATGSKSIDNAIRDAVNRLSESGIKTLEWDKENGRKVVRRADSHVRMNIEEGVNRLNQNLMERNAKIFDADGVQVSMHHLCAPDHQDIQGMQYSIKEYEAIDSTLTRPIGTLNCKHFITYCILSISPPLYSKEQIQEAKNNSNKIVEYNGKQMTRYDASQRMRAYERSIRKYRSSEKAFRSAGDTDLANQTKDKITAQLNNYRNFCSQVGLTTRMDRTKYVI